MQTPNREGSGLHCKDKPVLWSDPSSACWRGYSPFYGIKQSQEDRSGLGIHEQSLLKYLKARNLQSINSEPRTVPRLQLPPLGLHSKIFLSSFIVPELQTHISNNLLDLSSKSSPPCVPISETGIQSPKPKAPAPG